MTHKWWPHNLWGASDDIYKRYYCENDKHQGYKIYMVYLQVKASLFKRLTEDPWSYAYIQFEVLRSMFEHKVFKGERIYMILNYTSKSPPPK